MSWPDHLPAVRGRLQLNAELAPFTWFRVGGPAEVLFCRRTRTTSRGSWRRSIPASG
jgi:UDP-N-acetylenolpyruvoylglucosamine reductase